jgi:hypothetical protein
VLLVSTSLLAQRSSTSPTCAASDQALRVVVHDIWAAYNHRAAAALDKLLDDRLVWVSDSGNLLSKAEILAPFRTPQGSMKLESAEEPENIRTAFADNMAIMSFTKAFKITHQPTGASFAATARMTETFVCTGGEWKVVAFQETMVPNPARQVYKPRPTIWTITWASTASARTATVATFRSHVKRIGSTKAGEPTNLLKYSPGNSTCSSRLESRYSSDLCVIDGDDSSELSTRLATVRSRPSASNDAGQQTGGYKLTCDTSASRSQVNVKSQFERQLRPETAARATGRVEIARA